MVRSMILLIFCTGWAAAVSRISVWTCRDSDWNPGLLCEDYCLENYRWCRKDIAFSCKDSFSEEFLTNDTELCGDSLFWSNQTCDVFYNDGSKASLGQRCSGGAQHCIYPWYLSSNYYYKVCEQIIIQRSFDYKDTD